MQASDTAKHHGGLQNLQVDAYDIPLTLGVGILHVTIQNLSGICGEKDAEMMPKCLKKSSDGEIVSSRQNYKSSNI